MCVCVRRAVDITQGLEYVCVHMGCGCVTQGLEYACMRMTVCVSHKGYCVCVHVRARMAVGVPNGCCVREYVCKYDCVCYTGAGVHMHMGTRVPETC